jgi:hypothetical protein
MAAWTLFVASTRKDVVRRLRDPWALLLWIGIPLVLGGLIVLAMGGGGGSTPKARVLVVDHDDSFVSQLLLGAMSSEQAGVIEAQALAEPEARKRMDAGEASALIVIPEGFGDAVLEERAVRLEVLTNPSQRILPGIVTSFLAILSEGSFYLHRVLGDEIRAMAESAARADDFDDLRVAEASVRIRRDIERVAPLLFPPAIEVATVIEEERGGEPPMSPASLYFPSVLFMALMFMAEGLADDVWRERTLGVLRRVAVGPAGAAPVLAGKLAAGWLLMLGVVTIGLWVGVLALDVPIARVLPAALWASFAGAVLLALMTAIKLVAGSQRAAGLVGNLLLFPMIMVGGSMIPFEAMPGWLAEIGRFTPNGWSMDVFKSIVRGSPEVGQVAAAFFALSSAGAGLVAASALRLRSFARGAS